MIIVDTHAAQMVVRHALETGAVRVLRGEHGVQELCVLGPDRSQRIVAFYLRYLPGGGRAWLTSAQGRGHDRRPVTGEACSEYGLLLTGHNPELVAALAALAESDDEVVRGDRSAFDGFRRESVAHEGDVHDPAATRQPASAAPPLPVVPVIWQWCLGERDITADFHAQQDADQARVWDQDFCVMVLYRDPQQPGTWCYGTGDAPIPDDLAPSRFRDPDSALQLLSVLHHRRYTAEPDAADL